MPPFGLRVVSLDQLDLQVDPGSQQYFRSTDVMDVIPEIVWHTAFPKP